MIDAVCGHDVGRRATAVRPRATGPTVRCRVERGAYGWNVAGHLLVDPTDGGTP
jgi:hypothetical protein